MLHGPEVESLFDRTRRAFTARDGELFGGDATAGTQVSNAGIAVTPYQWPDDTRSVAGAALRLRTASIARGSDELAAAAAPAVSLAASGAAEIDHGGAVEQVRNTAGGLEQSWDFAAAPSTGASSGTTGRAAPSRRVPKTGTCCSPSPAASTSLPSSADGTTCRRAARAAVESRVPAICGSGAHGVDGRFCGILPGCGPSPVT